MLFECNVCGYVYDESNEKISWNDLPENYVCPICDSGKAYFESSGGLEEEPSIEDFLSESEVEPSKTIETIEYPSTFARNNDDVEDAMHLIHEMAITGHSVIEPMRSRVHEPEWKNILIAGAQLDPMVLNENDPVSTTTVIGKKAKQPMTIEHPVFITHMSYGALSKEFKVSLAKGSAAIKTAMCSGEGGILSESMAASYKYIFEYVPNRYSVTEGNLKTVDAIEIKIGQGTKPGMGGHLPGEKVTDEIAKVRNKPFGEDIISPSKFDNVNNKEELKLLVEQLRDLSGGKPIGVKVAAGHIEKDLDVIAYSGADFVTIDGRGGGTGASPKMIKDATSVPTVFALHRARKYMDQQGMDMDLIITGGLRVSSDFAKALAMGADAIAIGTAAMMATACQQYKVCHKGKCPVGCATQDADLRKRLDMDHGAKRLYNYLSVCLEELKTFARITGHEDVHDLCIKDLYTISHNISMYTNIKHV